MKPQDASKQILLPMHASMSPHLYTYTAILCQTTPARSFWWLSSFQNRLFAHRLDSSRAASAQQTGENITKKHFRPPSLSMMSRSNKLMATPEMLSLSSHRRLLPFRFHSNSSRPLVCRDRDRSHRDRGCRRRSDHEPATPSRNCLCASYQLCFGHCPQRSCSRHQLSSHNLHTCPS